MKTRPTRPPAAETRQALLDAAGSVFAARGFRDATVRDICRRAGANLAAVNYHFGGKQGLYREVLRDAYSRALAKHPPDHGAKPGAPAAERLGAFVHAFLLRIFDDGPGAWHGKLLAREMVDPTAALDLLVRERFRPQAQLLGSIVAELLGLPPDHEAVRRCSFSVVSQCLFFHNCRPVIERLFPAQKFAVGDIAALAEHITRFCLAALREFVAKRPGARRSAKKSSAP